MPAERRTVEIAPGHRIGCRRVVGEPARAGFVRVRTSSHRPPFDLPTATWDAAHPTTKTGERDHG